MNFVKEYFKKETDGYLFSQIRMIKIFYMLYIPTCFILGTLKLITKGVINSIELYVIGLLGFIAIYCIDSNYKSQ